jgi:hypothetical protein
LIVRYIDSRNYIFLEYDRSTGDLSLNEKKDGTDFGLDGWSVGLDSAPKLRLQMRFNRWRVWFNDVEQGTPVTQFVRELSNPKPGYAGIASSTGRYRISYFHLKDFEADITSEDLIRTALAMGDFHDVIVGGATSKMYAIIWGPQTDTQTMAEALLQSMQIDKLQMAWRNGMVEIGKFNDPTSTKTIENEIIESDTVQEAKRRINIAIVDGNDEHWLQADVEDAVDRGYMVPAYFDLPELLDLDAVKARAIEEMKRSAQGSSPGGTTPLFFDLQRMDTITWKGVTCRIDGFDVEIKQNEKPSQRQTFDLTDFATITDLMGEITVDDPDTEVDEEA